MVINMGSCNIGNGSYNYTVDFVGTLNIRAENESDLLGKLVNLLKENNIVLKKTSSIKCITSKNR